MDLFNTRCISRFPDKGFSINQYIYRNGVLDSMISPGYLILAGGQHNFPDGITIAKKDTELGGSVNFSHLLYNLNTSTLV